MTDTPTIPAEPSLVEDAPEEAARRAHRPRGCRASSARTDPRRVHAGKAFEQGDWGAAAAASAVARTVVAGVASSLVIAGVISSRP